jgi:hypothetical protein
MSNPEDLGGCEMEPPKGWYCTRDFHHNGPCAFKKLPDTSAVTKLPDGSGFGILSFPLPKDHWLYAPRTYTAGDHQLDPDDLPKPIFTHHMEAHVVAAIRYAVRAATNCGTEDDFDPDALVQNAVYALCGPYGIVEAKNANG